MNLISLATSRLGSRLIITLCRILPGTWAYRLASGLACYLASRRQLPFVEALYRNMAVVGNLPEGHPELEGAVRRLLHNTLCSYVDLFCAVSAGPEAIYAACRFDTAAYRLIETCAASNQGLLLVGAHMSSFDILLLGLRKLFPSVQVLSKANPTGSSTVMNDIRQQHGLDVTPISARSLRQAIHTLRSGGVVAIAADLPSEDGEELLFFGRKSRLVTGHTRLAARANAKMVVGASRRVGPGVYRALATPIPQPAPTGDRRHDMTRWAQESLRAIEAVIHSSPEEWLMPLPVWPDLGPQYGIP
jgi:lauroyl/myristoyl acyltransferase